MWDAVGYCTLPTICKYLILHAPHNKLLRPWLWWFFFKLPREMLEGACTPGCWAMPSNKEFKRTGGLSFNHRGQHTRVTISTMWSQRHRIPYPMWPVTGSIEVYWILLPDDFVLLEKWFFLFFFVSCTIVWQDVPMWTSCLMKWSQEGAALGGGQVTWVVF